MKWSRDKTTGHYHSDCGRFVIRNSRGAGYPWDVYQPANRRGEMSGYSGSRKTLAACKALAASIVRGEIDAAAYVAERQREIDAVAASPTCPDGVDWLVWHNLRNGETVTMADLAAANAGLSLDDVQVAIEATEVGCNLPEALAGWLVNRYDEQLTTPTHVDEEFAFYCGRIAGACERSDNVWRFTIIIDGSVERVELTAEKTANQWPLAAEAILTYAKANARHLDEMVELARAGAFAPTGDGRGFVALISESLDDAEPDDCGPIFDQQILCAELGAFDEDATAA
jgi:hypothetical protein